MRSERNLLSSAKEFLVEALGNYSEGKYSFAIVHAVTATELVLKERLARVNPALIFRNIDAPSLMKEQTVTLHHMPSRNRGQVMQSGILRKLKNGAES